jgi:DNA polymerase-3 subunit delta
MAVIKTGEADHFLGRPPADISFFLLHGNEEGLIRERCALIVKAALGESPDPLSISRLPADSLAREAGLLADEAYAIPLFGGKKVIWIDNAGQNLAPSLKLLLEAPPKETIILVECEVLAKGSELRTLFEQSAIAASVECYPDERPAIRRMIDASLRDAKLSITADVQNNLADLLGLDRLASRAELDKLILYAHGQIAVTSEDVEAAVASAAPSPFDSMIDAAFTGSDAELRRIADQLSLRAAADDLMLAMIAQHAIALHAVRLEIDKGRAFEQALRNARVDVFFKRRASFQRQLAIWSVPRLVRLLALLGAAMIRPRREGHLAHVVALRTTWSIASLARARF